MSIKYHVYKYELKNLIIANKCVCVQFNYCIHFNCEIMMREDKFLVVRVLIIRTKNCKHNIFVNHLTCESFYYLMVQGNHAAN